MKINVGAHVLDVVFNPGRKTDGRPNAGLTYTASLRCSSEGVVRLTLATDFTPPCVLVELPVFDVSVAGPTLAELGLYMPSVSGWVEPRPGVYAFVDGVQYVEPVPEELEFMAAFGFTPGARFDLALPMLRAQRAGWPLADSRQSWDSDEVLEALPVQLPTREENVAAVSAAADAVVAKASPEVPAEVLDTHADPAKRGTDAVKPARRQRRPAKPAGKVEIVSQALGEPTEEVLVPDAVADVFAVLDEKPTPAPKAAPAAMESNPFMIEGL